MQPKSHFRHDGVVPYGKDTEPEIAIAVSRVSGEPVHSKGDEERLHIFWRVFGGAILSITALIGVTMYNGIQSSVSELRAEVAKLNDQRAEVIRKDEFNTRMTSSHERINTVQTQCNAQTAAAMSLKTDLEAQKERLTKAAADLDGTRRETALTIETVKKDVAALESVKEKLTAITGEVKLLRDDVQKTRGEVEKNQIGDQERKARRDELQKEMEKLLKDLQTAVQQCQVKVARLEGQQQATPPKPKETP